MSRKSKTEAVAETVNEVEISEAEAVEIVKKGSIVPARYAGKYKNGGSDALAAFINDQSNVESVFSFDRFFKLCHQNGLAEAHVAPYEQAVADKVHGSQGRARMTLRNRLASLVRKNGKLVDLDGNEVAIELAPLPPRGKKAVAAAEAEQAEASEEVAA